MKEQEEIRFEQRLASGELQDAANGLYSFKPSIGNATKVLKHTRPKRLAESSQQQLHRMIYEVKLTIELYSKYLT